MRISVSSSKTVGAKCSNGIFLNTISDMRSANILKEVTQGFAITSGELFSCPEALSLTKRPEPNMLGWVNMLGLNIPQEKVERAPNHWRTRIKTHKDSTQQQGLCNV